MANRFLDTNFYKSPFVRGLKGPLKSLYSFIICDCTHSGIWAKDLEAAALYTGFPLSNEEFDENFVKIGKAILISNCKYFFPDFIEHQYPSGLSTNNKAHTKTIEELEKFQLLDADKTTTSLDKKNNKYFTYFAITNKAPSMGLQSSYGNGNGNGNGNKGVPGGGVFKDFKLEFTDDLKQSCLEILCRRNFGVTGITKETVENFYSEFCETQKSSDEIYQSVDKIWLHFKRWLPKQKINFNGTAKQSVANKHQAGIDAALARGKQKFAAAGGKSS